MNNEELAARCESAAQEIADEGHNGWGNLLTEAATALRAAEADRKRFAEILSAAKQWGLQATAAMDVKSPLALTVIDRYAELSAAIDKAMSCE